VSTLQALTGAFKGRKGRLEVVGLVTDADESEIPALEKIAAAVTTPTPPAPPAATPQPELTATEPEPKPTRKPRAEKPPASAPAPAASVEPQLVPRRRG
jgi:hypothetical protein